MRIPTLLLAFLPMTVLPATPAPSCQTMDEQWNSRTVACALPANGASQGFEFIARFTGGHDDTEVSIEPTSGDQPLACAEGSKLSSMGEFGDIALSCRFTVQVATTVAVTIKFSHAEYADMELRAR